MYSTTQGNFFFQVDERSPCSYPKFTKEETEEVHNDWFEGLRRLRDDDSRFELSQINLPLYSLSDERLQRIIEMAGEHD